MPRRALLLLAAVVAPTLAAPLAMAHALPVTSNPASGAVLQAPPRQVSITFSERVEPGPSGVEVRASNGTVVSGPSQVQEDGRTIVAPLPGTLAYGTYTVAWHTTSAEDGHSTRGLLSFLYHDPSKPLTAGDLPGEAQEQSLVSPVDPVLRALQYGGLMLALGTALLMLVVAPRGPAPPARGVAAFVLGASLAGALGALTLALSEESVAASLGGAGGWFADRFGELALARAVLLVLAGGLAFAAGRSGARGRALWAAGAACAAGAVVTTSLASHAAALPDLAALAIGLDALHLAAGAAWVGGLVALAWVLWRGSGEEPGWEPMALRYSALAMGASLTVVGTGVLQGALELKTLDALLGSTYGQVLLLKSALVVGLLGFGGLHRFRLIPALRIADPARAWRRLGASMRREAALGIAVVCVAGLLTSLSPPLPAAPPGPPPELQLAQVKDGENLTVLLSPNPVRVGEVALDLFLYTSDGLSDTNATNVTLTLKPPDPTLGTSAVKLDHPHPGHFSTDGPLFAMAGNWTMRFDVQRIGAFDVVADFPLQVEPAAG